MARRSMHDRERSKVAGIMIRNVQRDHLLYVVLGTTEQDRVMTVIGPFVREKDALKQLELLKADDAHGHMKWNVEELATPTTTK